MKIKNPYISQPLRRGQLITTNGIGALSITKDRVGVITAGLDHWYKNRQTSEVEDVKEFKITDEWRLQQVCRVNHFRIPPDFRKSSYLDREKINLFITIPHLIFPLWTYCKNCLHMDKKSPHSMTIFSECEQTIENKKGIKQQCRGQLVQVPMITMCEAGHIDEFPFYWWLQQDASGTRCEDKDHYRKKLKFNFVRGQQGVAAYKITCECGKERSLNGCLGDGRLRTKKCNGINTWNSKEDKLEENEKCNKQVHGSLKSAKNVYFSIVRSSIFVPKGGRDNLNEKILEIMEKKYIFQTLQDLYDLSKGGAITRIDSKFIKDKFPDHFDKFEDNEIDDALKHIFQKEDIDSYDDSSFLFAEYDFINKVNTKKKDFEASEVDLKDKEYKIFDEPLNKYFDSIKKVIELRETKALLGFSRIFPKTSISSDEEINNLKSMLWLDKNKARGDNSWLPATKVKGEGVFFKLNKSRIEEWERNDSIKERIETLKTNYTSASLKQFGKEPEERDLQKITPRFVLIHTLAHLLINQFVNYCGYNAASLKERIYASDNKDSDMAGFLVYTADGDSEGTMGGLVRMVQPYFLNQILEDALEQAHWCSVDPVCMEAGEGKKGQGPLSVNLAACHNCALVPETSCDHFNYFLDRGVVCGTTKKPDLGYFDTIK